jgi:hypothetical protein
MPQILRVENLSPGLPKTMSVGQFRTFADVSGVQWCFDPRVDHGAVVALGHRSLRHPGTAAPLRRWMMRSIANVCAPFVGSIRICRKALAASCVGRTDLRERSAKE